MRVTGRMSIRHTCLREMHAYIDACERYIPRGFSGRHTSLVDVNRLQVCRSYGSVILVGMIYRSHASQRRASHRHTSLAGINILQARISRRRASHRRASWRPPYLYPHRRATRPAWVLCGMGWGNQVPPNGSVILLPLSIVSYQVPCVIETSF